MRTLRLHAGLAFAALELGRIGFARAAEEAAPATPPAASAAIEPAAAAPPPPAAPDSAPPPLVDVTRPPAREDGAATEAPPARREAGLATEPPPPPPPREPEPTDGTPRSGTFSGYFFGFFGGVAALRPAVGERAAVGPGGAVGLSVGIALWDQLPLDFGFGGFFLKDRQPFSQLVQNCSTYGGATVSCGDPQSQQSSANATVLTFETGYQRRFRPWTKTSFLPAVLAGYLVNPGGMSRGVGCDGCAVIPIHGVTVSGAYLAPSFKVTLGAKGMFAIGMRSQIFVTGDLGHVTVLGLDVGAP